MALTIHTLTTPSHFPTHRQFTPPSDTPFDLVDVELEVRLLPPQASAAAGAGAGAALGEAQGELEVRADGLLRS